MTYLELYEKATRQLEKSEITLGEYEEMVEPLNSEIPTRKHGEWEEEVFDLGANLPVRVAYQCSECGNYFDSEFNFCPHCGTDMRGREE